MKKNLQNCYKNYFGCGNPRARYWFLGFEPGGDSSDPEYKSHLVNDNEIEFLKYAGDYSNEKVEPGVLTQLITLLIQLELKSSYEINLEDRKLKFSNSGEAFYTNLFLLKFPSEKDKKNPAIFEFYKNYFEIESESCSRDKLYPDSLILNRSNLFSKYIIEPKILFILKKGWEKSYLSLLNVSNPTLVNFPYDENNVDKSDIYLGNNHIIVFLRNGWFSYDGIHQILEKIRSLK